MTESAKRFIQTYDNYIEDSEWEKLLEESYEVAALRNRVVQEVVEILEKGLDIDLYEIQSKLFLNKFKAAIEARHPGTHFRTDAGAIKIKSWLLSSFWTNLYGLSLDDAIGVLIDNFDVEETPDEGTLLW